MTPQEKWDRRFLGLARLVASWSKDPSTQTGAVIVDGKRRVVSVGYNGFPAGVDDDPARYADRETKYRLIIHCERNALLFAARPLDGCTLYTVPFMSCAPCAALVIQAGITRCVAPVLPPRLVERWGAETDLAAGLFREAGVELCLLPDPTTGGRP
jgi:dCMP deaminase